MKDFSFVLDTEESVNVGATIGDIPKSDINLFIWQENEDRLILSINVEGKERAVVTVSDRGKRIKMKEKE